MKTYDIPGILSRMIKAERENKKRVMILRQSPVLIKKILREEKKQAKIKKDDNVFFMGMA